jgi:hypothetical protein
VVVAFLMIYPKIAAWYGDDGAVVAAQQPS